MRLLFEGVVLERVILRRSVHGGMVQLMMVPTMSVGGTEKRPKSGSQDIGSKVVQYIGPSRRGQADTRGVREAQRTRFLPGA